MYGVCIHWNENQSRCNAIPTYQVGHHNKAIESTTIFGTAGSIIWYL